MHAPDWVSEALYRVSPNARLGWAGEERTSDEEELNKGTFALIELYSKRDARHTLLEKWNKRGPIFGRDWDRMTDVPVYVIEVDTKDVFSGKIVKLVKRWLTPIQERFDEINLERGREYESMANDITGAMAERMVWKANRTDATSPEHIPNKHMTKRDKAILTGDYEKENLKEKFLTPAPGMFAPKAD